MSDTDASSGAGRSGSTLEARRVIVTGGSSGIGLATAQRFAAEGARVAVLDLVAPPAGTGALVYVHADVSDEQGARLAVEDAVEQLGGLDVLVNNAGIGADGTVEDNPDEEWRRVYEVNVLGTVRVSRAALPALRRSSSPAIVNTGSVVADTGLVRRAVYSASKGAIHALTRAMAADHLAEGIRVNAVAPGTADTPWVARLLAQAEDPEAQRAALIARQPHGRLVGADEVAAAIVYLASPDAGSTTGSVLAVDGGLSSLRLAARPPAASAAEAPVASPALS